MHSTPGTGSRLRNTLMAAAAVTFTVFIVLNPDPAFRAAVNGLGVWWDIVFPALLPFFIGSEILMGLGVVHLMGVLLEPFMRPVFNVPGAGSFVMAMGLASGYPIGAMLTARLRNEGLCSVTEGERLMSFTNTADPLFMTGAVAVGMFGRADAAMVILAAHYLSSLSVGVLLRFYRPGADRTPPIAARHGRSMAARAWYALNDARERDGRPFGKLLGDAVRNSVNTLLLIGGFIILFAVLVQVLDAVGAVAALGGLIGRVLALVGVDTAVAGSLVSGVFEITIGAQAASRAAAGLLPRLVAASAIIAWSGLSVHAQVASMTQGTGMQMGPYVAARFVHAWLAGLYTVLLWRPAQAMTRNVSLPASWLAAPGAAGGQLWALRLRSFGIATGTMLLAVGMLFAFRTTLQGVTFVFIDRPPRRRRR
ncbi:MAG: sporulation integral membrane protein YlbJ [Bacillota bacterium]|nr:sporulation integral membrane protein YlbJ [Bacillota bacterium]